MDVSYLSFLRTNDFRCVFRYNYGVNVNTVYQHIWACLCNGADKQHGPELIKVVNHFTGKFKQPFLHGNSLREAV